MGYILDGGTAGLGKGLNLIELTPGVSGLVQPPVGEVGAEGVAEVKLGYLA